MGDPGGERPIPRPGRPRPLIIGAGAGIGAAIQLVERARAQRMAAGAWQPARAAALPWRPLVLLESDDPFPFRPRPSVIVVPGIPTGVIACMPLLEEWGIASRLASATGAPGCFEGSVTALAEVWLASLPTGELEEVEMFARGSAEALAAAAALARRYGLPLDA